MTTISTLVILLALLTLTVAYANKDADIAAKQSANKITVTTRNKREFDNYPRGGQGYPSASYGAPSTGFQGYSYNRPPNQLTYPQYLSPQLLNIFGGGGGRDRVPGGAASRDISETDKVMGFPARAPGGAPARGYPGGGGAPGFDGYRYNRPTTQLTYPQFAYQQPNILQGGGGATQRDFSETNKVMGAAFGAAARDISELDRVPMRGGALGRYPARGYPGGGGYPARGYGAPGFDGYRYNRPTTQLTYPQFADVQRNILQGAGIKDFGELTRFPGSGGGPPIFSFGGPGGGDFSETDRLQFSVFAGPQGYNYNRPANQLTYPQQNRQIQYQNSYLPPNNFGGQNNLRYQSHSDGYQQQNNFRYQQNNGYQNNINYQGSSGTYLPPQQSSGYRY